MGEGGHGGGGGGVDWGTTGGSRVSLKSFHVVPEIFLEIPAACGPRAPQSVRSAGGWQGPGGERGGGSGLEPKP